MVPPQSYFDVQTTQYTHTVYLPPIDPWHQDFIYAGRNVYAYWLAKFGRTAINEVVTVKCEEEIFEEVEGWELVNTSCDHVVVQNEEFDFTGIHQTISTLIL